jgi:hypothetical protein
MDKLKTIRADQRLARANLAGCELKLAEAKRELDRARLANERLHAGLRRRQPGMRTVFVAEAISFHKQAEDRAFSAWADACQARERALKLCCELADKLRKAKAHEELP